MLTCAFCGGESPDGFKFCPECGTPFGAKRLLPEERRVITTLFCDLVGFTATSEAADAEDVDRMLRDYNKLARRVVNSCGGIVEKFIGDAVVAVFGVPLLHEDDAERAVRAGLRLIEELADLPPLHDAPIRARVGINTGEVYVRLDVDPESGETFLTGDAVNTAARLQSAAPPMGVVVGSSTHALTVEAFDFEELEPVVLKGKAEPVPCWLATTPKAYTGAELAKDYVTAFIGRERELALLKGLFEKAAQGQEPQFVLLFGEPGIGKSRIVAEFAAYLEDFPDMTHWRQGRCPPYGDGVSFWALGEILKAHAGILESDDTATVEQKLERVLPDGPDREWLRQRLRPLLGLEAPPASRDENFAAWRLFLEHLTADYPAVLVFEDLHWADEALLAFLDYLAGNATGTRLLVLGLTRPDVFEHVADFAASGLWNERIDVQPLSARETTRLVAGLFAVDGLPQEVQDAVLERVGGNPLYAEEFARLLMDQDLLEHEDGVLRLKEGASITLPESVQAVIGARLDRLPLEHKALLADAAVVGRVFWGGALQSIGERDRDEVVGGMQALAERRLVRPSRTSSFVGESEWIFWHGMARDVAYAQLPRAARAAKHAAVGGWIEEVAGDRAEDLSETLAHHYATALEFAEASREVELASAMVDPSVRFLALAGDRAMGLDFATAERHYARAVTIAPKEGERRPRLMMSWGRSLHRRGQFREAWPVLEEAVTGLQDQGEIDVSATALMSKSAVLTILGDPKAFEVAEASAKLAETCVESPAVGAVLANWASCLAVLERHEAVIEAADKAIKVKGLAPADLVLALGCRGAARCSLGDKGGLNELREALEIARERGVGYEMGVVGFNLASALALFEGPGSALELRREGLEAARRRGNQQIELAQRMGVVDDLAWVGRWQESLDELETLVPVLQATDDLYDLVYVRTNQLQILSCQGRFEEAEPLMVWAEEKAQEAGEPCATACCLLAAADVRIALGGTAESLQLLRACGEHSDEAMFRSYDFVIRLSQAVRTSLAAPDRDLAEVLVDDVTSTFPLSEHALMSAKALLAENAGEHETAAAGFADAAARWHGFGVPYEEAQALLGQGRCLVALERAPEAAAPLEAAREIFARLGAKPALVETDRVLESATISPAMIDVARSVDTGGDAAR